MHPVLGVLASLRFWLSPNSSAIRRGVGRHATNAAARLMAEHFRERHAERRVGATAGLGEGGSNHPNDQMIDHEPPRTART